MRLHYTNLSSIEPSSDFPIVVYYASDVKQLARDVLPHLTHVESCDFLLDTLPCTCGVDDLIQRVQGIVGARE